MVRDLVVVVLFLSGVVFGVFLPVLAAVVEVLLVRATDALERAVAAPTEATDDAI